MRKLTELGKIPNHTIPLNNKYLYFGASQVVLVVKNLAVKAGDIRDTSLIPGSGRCPEGRHGNSLQYSSLENSMYGGAWWATVHGVTKSQTRLK